MIGVSMRVTPIAFVARDIEELDSRAGLVRQDIARYQTRVEKIPEVQNELQALEREYGLISQYYCCFLH